MLDERGNAYYNKLLDNYSRRENRIADLDVRRRNIQKLIGRCGGDIENQTIDLRTAPEASRTYIIEDIEKNRGIRIRER